MDFEHDSSNLFWSKLPAIETGEEAGQGNFFSGLRLIRGLGSDFLAIDDEFVDERPPARARDSQRRQRPRTPLKFEKPPVSSRREAELKSYFRAEVAALGSSTAEPIRPREPAEGSHQRRSKRRRTSAFVVTGSLPTVSPAPRPVKSSRVRRACAACNSRKTRCEAQRPCGPCIRKGIADSCVDATFGDSATPAKKRRKVQQRRLRDEMHTPEHPPRAGACYRTVGCTRPYRHPGHCKLAQG